MNGEIRENMKEALSYIIDQSIPGEIPSALSNSYRILVKQFVQLVDHIGKRERGFRSFTRRA